MILTEEMDGVFTLQDDTKAMQVVLDMDLGQLIEVYNQIQEKLKQKGILF